MHCGCNAQIRYSWISIHNTLCDDDYCKHAFYFSIFIHWKSAIIIFPLICHEWPAATHRTIRTKFSMCDSELFTICFSFSLFFEISKAEAKISLLHVIGVYLQPIHSTSYFLYYLRSGDAHHHRSCLLPFDSTALYLFCMHNQFFLLLFVLVVQLFYVFFCSRWAKRHSIVNFTFASCVCVQ